jgi:hypothetical protein
VEVHDVLSAGRARHARRGVRFGWRPILAEGFKPRPMMRTPWVALVPGIRTHASVGEWRARDPTQFALAGSFVRGVGAAIRWRQLQWTSLGASTLSRFRVERLQVLRTFSTSDPPRLTRLDEPFPNDRPTSDVPPSFTSTAPRLQSAKSAHRPIRYRLGCDFTRESEPPGARPVRSVRSYDPERLPS